jgi:membrane-associated protease RseP (regulator of RpoE activity)
VADDQTPDENTEPASAEAVPTAAASDRAPEPTATDHAPEPASAAAPSAAAPSSARGWIWGAAAIVVVGLLVGAYFVGRSSVDQGPSSLADAVHQTAKGDLPVGNLSLNDVTSALGKNASILGGKSGGASSLLDGLLKNLGKDFENKLKDGLANGLNNGNSSGSSQTPVAQAFLGVATGAAPSGQTGAQVTTVKAGSPAADAGLQQGDVITAVDGKAVTSSAALATQVQAHSPGDVVTITYTRNGTSAEVRVRLGNTTTPTTTTTPTI